MTDLTNAPPTRGELPPRQSSRDTGGQSAVVRIEIYAAGTAVDVNAPPGDGHAAPAPASAAPRTAEAPTLHAIPTPTPAATLLHDPLSETMTADMRRRERRVRQSESELHDRQRELEDRVRAVEVREAELEVAFGLREERIERRETDVSEREERLRRKEDDLARYVGQVQAQFARAG